MVQPFGLQVIVEEGLGAGGASVLAQPDRHHHLGLGAQPFLQCATDPAGDGLPVCAQVLDGEASRTTPRTCQARQAPANQQTCGGLRSYGVVRRDDLRNQIAAHGGIVEKGKRGAGGHMFPGGGRDLVDRRLHLVGNLVVEEEPTAQIDLEVAGREQRVEGVLDDDAE